MIHSLFITTVFAANEDTVSQDDLLSALGGLFFIAVIIYFSYKHQQKVKKIEDLKKQVPGYKIPKQLNPKELIAKKIKDAGWAIRTASLVLLFIAILLIILGLASVQAMAFLLVFGLVIGGIGFGIFKLGDNIYKGKKSIDEAKSSLQAFFTISIILLFLGGIGGLVSLATCFIYVWPALRAIKKYEEDPIPHQTILGSK